MAEGDTSLAQQDMSNLVPIFMGEQFIGYVTPQAAAKYYQNYKGPGGGGAMPEQPNLLAIGSDTAQSIYQLIEIGDIDDNYRKAQDTRDTLVAKRTDLVASANTVNKDFGSALKSYLDSQDDLDLYQTRVLETQLKCLWASALSAGGRALGELMKGGMERGGASAWIVGGVAAGGFLLAELFTHRRRGGTGPGKARK